MSDNVFDSMSEKQIKEKIRYLSDKLETLYNLMKPQIEEFELIQEELELILEYADNVSK